MTFKGFERLALNAKFACMRCIGMLIRFAPFKAAILNGIGTVAGLFLMVMGCGYWRAIRAFARHSGSRLPIPIYLARYFIQQGRDGVWGHVFCEAPTALSRYVGVLGREAIDAALAAGKGAVILGAHYGPALYGYVLHGIAPDLKFLIARNYLADLERANTLVGKPFRGRKVIFLNDPNRVVVSHEGEKILVAHVRAGGAVLMHIDFPNPAGVRNRTSFFGASMNSHTFPFRLALGYGTPIFFCLFERSRDGGYLLNIIPCGTFATPEEGFEKYLALLQAKIGENPFMWGLLPVFHEWVRCRRLRRTDGAGNAV